jgi:hypothetical protein
MEAPRVNTVARQVPLMSSPGAIDNIITHAPELGIPDAGAGVEPYGTLVRVAGQLEGLPYRYGAHPSAYTLSFYGRGALAWLPAQWVSDGHFGRRQAFGTARHLAVVAEERVQVTSLAHRTAVPANEQLAHAQTEHQETDGPGVTDLVASGGPVNALQCTKDDLEALGLVRLDISPSAAMSTSTGTGTDTGETDPDPATGAAAWRLLEAGNTPCISQVESVGFRMLLKTHEPLDMQSNRERALESIEDLAQTGPVEHQGPRGDVLRRPLRRPRAIDLSAPVDGRGAR